MSTAITTWSHVQSRLELDAADETKATELIDIASARAEKYIGRVIAATDIIKYFDGTSRKLLQINQWPINTVSNVYIDSGMDFATESEVTDYKILSDRGVLFRSSGWGFETQSVKVVANVGYITVPDDLLESIVQLVGYWLNSPTMGWLSTGEAQSGGYQTQYVGVMDIPFQIRNLWDEYRR